MLKHAKENIEKTMNHLSIIEKQIQEFRGLNEKPLLAEQLKWVETIENFIRDKKQIVFDRAAIRNDLKIKDHELFGYKVYSSDPGNHALELGKLLNKICPVKVYHSGDQSNIQIVYMRFSIINMFQTIDNVPSSVTGGILYTPPLWNAMHLYRNISDPLLRWDNIETDLDILLRLEKTLLGGKLVINKKKVCLEEIEEKLNSMKVIFLGNIAYNKIIKLTKNSSKTDLCDGPISILNTSTESMETWKTKIMETINGTIVEDKTDVFGHKIVVLECNGIPVNLYQPTNQSYTYQLGNVASFPLLLSILISQSHIKIHQKMIRTLFYYLGVGYKSGNIGNEIDNPYRMLNYEYFAHDLMTHSGFTKRQRQH